MRTPGPWEWRHFDNERGMCLQIGGLTIEGIDNCYVSCHQDDQRLMEATPDLLEAAKALAKLLDRNAVINGSYIVLPCDSHDQAWNYLHEARDLLKAAIAKAGG